MTHAMSSRALLSVMLVGCMCLEPALAHAQEPAPAEQPKTDNRARAQQLFDSALADAEAGNFAAACPKFLASQEADPKTSTLLNLANCYEKNGQTASAWGAFREAETLARKAGRSDWETAARTRAEALEPKLARVSIVVSEANRVSGLAISRDGLRLAPGEWGVAIPVDPGEHTITASAEGHKSWESRVTVAPPQEPSTTSKANATTVVDVPKLEELPRPSEPPLLPPQPAPPPPDKGWSTWKTVGAIGAGVGVAGIAVGGLLGLVAKGDYNNARAQCLDGTRGCPASAIDDSNSAYDLAAGATVIFVSGAVLLAAGATLFLIDPGSSSSASAKPARPFVGVGPGAIHGAF